MFCFRFHPLPQPTFFTNLFIIRAWVFAAGLVLGFSLLADDASDGDTREAFRGSQHVLNILGRISAQAAQYHQILSTFSEAIDLYRRQKRSERIESRVPFVEQILSYDNHHHNHNHHHNDDPTSSFSGVSGNNMMRRMGRDDGGEIFDQFIPRENMCQDNSMRANIDVLGQQQDRALQEMGLSSGASFQQLPTPDFNVDEMGGGGGGSTGGGGGSGGGGGGGGGGYWNGSDTLSSMSMSDFLPEHWPPPADNELMLRLLWDGYAMSFDDPALLHAHDGTRNAVV